MRTDDFPCKARQGHNGVRIRQGDQIGRKFALWGIVYFVQLLDNYNICSHFFGCFFDG
jgi:hypothetical protein